MALKNIVVFNDEAHHCYREKPDPEAPKLTGGNRKEAEENVESILENLRRAGVHQKGDRIEFTLLKPWPGELICAEGRYSEGEADAAPERRAGIFIAPEYGTVQRADLVAAAR
jgi:adenine-specific DNA-methyltransferase